MERKRKQPGPMYMGQLGLAWLKHRAVRFLSGTFRSPQATAAAGPQRTPTRTWPRHSSPTSGGVPAAAVRNFPLVEGFTPPPKSPPHPSTSRDPACRGADAMPPRRRRRAPAKPQSQPDPQQQESPGEDAPLEERLAWDSHQESTAPQTPPSLPHLR